jgi:hypothetical protein
MIRFLYTIITLLISLLPINSSGAADAERDCAKDREWCRSVGKECRPEHQRRCGKRKGDWYGARRAVHSAEDARGLFVAYFAGQDVTISAINEKPWRFEADVKDRSGNIVDRVIVDKRSGRVRSIY